MNFFLKKKVSNLIILTLVLLNIILLGSFWYNNIHKTEDNYIKKNSTINQNRPERKHNPDIRPGIRSFLENKFSFTEDQISKFKNLRDRHFIYAEKIKSEIENIRKEMMELLLENKIDENLVKNLSLKIGAKITEHERLVFSHFQDLLKISDDKQIGEYKYFILGMFDRKKPKKEKPLSNGRMPSTPRPKGFQRDKERRGNPLQNMENFNIENRLNHLSRRLNLSKNQTSKIRRILEERIKNNINSGKRKHRPSPTEHHRKMLEQDQKIENLLNEEQKEEFIRLKKERRKRDRR